jgi:enoyl-CoA hydratase
VSVAGGSVVVDRPAPHVVRVTIDRPPVNAIDSVTQAELTDALQAAAADLDVRTVVLTGAGEHFCGGADLREEQSMEREQVGGFLRGIGRLIHAVREHRVPVIAAIPGAAHGGGLELALACDIRIGSERAHFAAAGVNLGLVANVHALAAVIGPARARHLLMTGWTCRAEQALDWGLVTELVEPDELQDRATAIASRIASRAPLAVEATKACANACVDLDPADAAALQAREFARLFRTADHAAAVRAFFGRESVEYERR